MSRRSSRTRRSSSRAQEEKQEALEEIFDDESEEEPVGDDSDEDPDFEFAAEDHAEDEEEYLAPAPVEDDDDDEEALLRKRKREHEYQQIMNKRQRVNSQVWSGYPQGRPPSMPSAVNMGTPQNNMYLKMIQSKYGHRGVGATAPAPGQAWPPGMVPQGTALPVRQQQQQQPFPSTLPGMQVGGVPGQMVQPGRTNSNGSVTLRPIGQDLFSQQLPHAVTAHSSPGGMAVARGSVVSGAPVGVSASPGHAGHAGHVQPLVAPVASPAARAAMSPVEMNSVRSLLLEYKLAQQQPDEELKKKALQAARAKMRQHPQLVAVLRAAAQKSAIAQQQQQQQQQQQAAAIAAAGGISTERLQANRAWQQQMQGEAVRQQYAERARAMQVATAQRLAMNADAQAPVNIPIARFGTGASAEDVAAREDSDMTETDRELDKVMKECEALAKRLAKLASGTADEVNKIVAEDAKKKKKDNDQAVGSADAKKDKMDTSEDSKEDVMREDGAQSTSEVKKEPKPEEKTDTDKPGNEKAVSEKADNEKATDKKGDIKNEVEGDGEKGVKKEVELSAEEKAAEEKKKAEARIVRKQPSILQHQLTHFQLVGLNWLNLLHSENLNGVLADEMGLGKTIQTIALLSLLKEREQCEFPHLIVCPTTTLSNWARELEVWCPTLSVIAYFGEQKERENLRRVISETPTDVIVTNYSAATGSVRDRQFIKGMQFEYLILDEAQYIKNKDSKRNKVLSKIKSKNRLLLTGTPLQNNLEELWALLQFIMPHMFGSTNLDLRSDDEDIDKWRINRMKTIIAPFFLRRLKRSPEVSQDIPEKTIIVEKCDMTETQKRSYENYISQSRKLWAAVQDQQATPKAKPVIEATKRRTRGKRIRYREYDSDDDFDESESEEEEEEEEEQEEEKKDEPDVSSRGRRRTPKRRFSELEV